MKRKIIFLSILVLAFLFIFNLRVEANDNAQFAFGDQTTPNMIQRISGTFERKPLISKEI